MAMYLFTWNPDYYEQLAEDYEKWLTNGSVVVPNWSTGTNKSIPSGAGIFVLRQRSRRGIIATGTTASTIHTPGRDPQNLNDIDIRIDQFSSPATPLISMEDLLRISEHEKRHWERRMSGTKMDNEIARKLKDAWRTAWDCRRHEAPRVGEILRGRGPRYTTPQSP